MQEKEIRKTGEGKEENKKEEEKKAIGKTAIGEKMKDKRQNE